MYKSDSSSANYPPVIYLAKIAPQPDLDTSVFNKMLQFGICIGLNESSILFIHYKMSIFLACETSIFLSKIPLANLSVRILSRSNDLLCKGPKRTAVKLLVNLPSILAVFFMARNFS